MKDIIQIRKSIISAQLSVTVERIDSTAYIGYIPSFDIPFTSPNEEKAGEIAKGLVNALFEKWIKVGGLKLFKEKLQEYKFFNYSSTRVQFGVTGLCFRRRPNPPHPNRARRYDRGRCHGRQHSFQKWKAKRNTSGASQKSAS